MIQKIALIAIAGSLGTLARFGLSSLVEKLAKHDFPWGTLVVNAVGCLLVGVLWESTRTRFEMSLETRQVLFVGFFGAFTTFATFIFDSSRFASESQWGALALNVLGQNALGFVSFFAGIALARAL